MYCGACGAFLVDADLTPEEKRGRAESIARSFIEVSCHVIDAEDVDWDDMDKKDTEDLIEVFVRLLNMGVVS